MRRGHLTIALPAMCVCLAALPRADADYTNNILLTGYWPPTNEMVRRFSTSPAQNPDGWIGANWEARGYDVHSYFPEFPGGWIDNPKGDGDLEVDYQDTSLDFWRIVAEVRPVAIITFSRGGRVQWEIETMQRNLAVWGDDYEAPLQPTPAPPDDSVPVDHIRLSTLPVDAIADAVNDADLGISARVDRTGFGGGFLSEFIAYHGTWYQALNDAPGGPAWCVAAGHIHVSGSVSIETGTLATHVTLRTLTEYLDSVIPAPGSAWVVAAFAAVASRRRRASNDLPSPRKGERGCAAAA